MTSQGIRRARNSVQVHARRFRFVAPATLVIAKRPARRHRHPTSKLGVGENLGDQDRKCVQFATVRFHFRHTQAALHRCQIGSKGGVKKCHIRLLDGAIRTELVHFGE